MEITIREASHQDAEAIALLNREAMGYDYPAEDTARKLEIILRSDRDKVFVAVTGECVVGYIHANDYDVLYFPTMKNIMGIAVDSAYRRQGIGKLLLNAVEHWAKETGAEGIRLVSGANRTDAHQFYMDCGFEGGKKQLNFKKHMKTVSNQT